MLEFFKLFSCDWMSMCTLQTCVCVCERELERARDTHTLGRMRVAAIIYVCFFSKVSHRNWAGTQPVFLWAQTLSLLLHTHTHQNPLTAPPAGRSSPYLTSDLELQDEEPWRFLQVWASGEVEPHQGAGATPPFIDPTGSIWWLRINGEERRHAHPVTWLAHTHAHPVTWWNICMCCLQPAVFWWSDLESAGTEKIPASDWFQELSLKIQLSSRKTSQASTNGHQLVHVCVRVC